MKIFTGLFMAWGNFLTVPCPCKKWDNDLKNYMLGFLPSVGLILGILWAAIALLLVMIGTPFLVMSFVITFVLFALKLYSAVNTFSVFIIERYFPSFKTNFSQLFCKSSYNVGIHGDLVSKFVGVTLKIEPLKCNLSIPKSLV